MQYRRSTRFSLPLMTFAIAAGAAVAASAQTIEVLPPGSVQLAQQTVIVAPAAPPPAQVETIPAPPTVAGLPEYWKPGHWNWTGGGWVWVGGAYVTPPQPTASWVPGQWVGQPGGGFVWVGGHWQS